MKNHLLYIAFIILALGIFSCTEPYEIESKGFERILVVESTITDQPRHQIVKLSRTTSLDNTAIQYESNAAISVVGSNGDNFKFSQDQNTGFYISDQIFAAQPNISYTLNILTSDGNRYSSSAVVLPPSVPMDKLYSERIVDPSGNKDGVHVLVDTEDPTGNSKYFRYEYEETYKITAPNPSPYIAEIINLDPKTFTFEIALTPREPEEICYSTEISTGISQTSTSELGENKIFRFPVCYLSKTDAKLQTRYSILVKQYVQSVEAYTFYKIIQELGSIESLLSQGQPGYVAGNIVDEGNPDAKVLGFFEVSSTTSKRIYFNYEDFNLPKPPFFYDCEVLILDYYDNTVLDGDLDERDALYTMIEFFDYQVIAYSSELKYTIAQPECSVCTYVWSNIKPDFWED